MAVTDASQPHREKANDRTFSGAEANARLTGSIGALLLILLAVEGLTILRVHAMLTLHVFIGILLVPPVLSKIGSTMYRFVRYYAGSSAYRKKGPPPLVLRLLGPILITVTIVMFASGIALLFVHPDARQAYVRIHEVSFVLWFGVMVMHVLGHIIDTARLAPADFHRRTRNQVPGAAMRQWALVGILAIGLVLAVLFVGRVGPYLAI